MKHLILLLALNFALASQNVISLDSCKNGNCKEIISLLEKTCSGGGKKACATLGYIYENGMGVEKDAKKALELYEKACDKDDDFACLNLGVLYASGELVKKDAKKANELFDNLCKKNKGDGCLNLGISYLNGDGVEKDRVMADSLLKKALNLYKNACDKNDANACFGLSNNMDSMKNIILELQKEGNKFENAEFYAKKACALDNELCEAMD